MGSLERPQAKAFLLPASIHQGAGMGYIGSMDTMQTEQQKLFDLLSHAAPPSKPTHDFPREEKMGNLCSAKYRLKREITIRVFEDEGKWFADYPDLDLIGWGEEEWQAREDLCKHIVDVYEELTTTEYKLSPHLEAQKQYLMDIVETRHG